MNNTNVHCNRMHCGTKNYLQTQYVLYQESLKNMCCLKRYDVNKDSGRFRKVAIMTSMIDAYRIMLALFIGYKVEQLSSQRSLTKSELGVR